MTEEKFIEEYCTLCGTQRCYGREYCGKYRELVMGEKQENKPVPIKKQYTVHENLFYRSTIRTYHDGKHIETYYKWDDETEKFIKDLEAEGYTLAFTKEEVDKIKEQYEYMIDKVLVEEKIFPKIQLKSNSSVSWETEEEYPLHTGRHSQ